jgi:hypothetical protein
LPNKKKITKNTVTVLVRVNCWKIERHCVFTL